MDFAKMQQRRKDTEVWAKIMHRLHGDGTSKVHQKRRTRHMYDMRKSICVRLWVKDQRTVSVPSLHTCVGLLAKLQ